MDNFKKITGMSSDEYFKKRAKFLDNERNEEKRRLAKERRELLDKYRYAEEAEHNTYYSQIFDAYNDYKLSLSY